MNAADTGNGSWPPKINTLPFASSVAVEVKKAGLTDGPRLKVPLDGSKISVASTPIKGVDPSPPTISTRPSVSRIAEWALRANCKLPAGPNSPVDGSNISAADVEAS